MVKEIFYFYIKQYCFYKIQSLLSKALSFFYYQNATHPNINILTM